MEQDTGASASQTGRSRAEPVVSALRASPPCADFTIADVLAWARTKPADETYDYQSMGNCALCQFLKATGRAEQPYVSTYSRGNPGGWRDGIHTERRPYEPALDAAVSAGDYVELRNPAWTFGQLVTRLEALCPATPVTQSDWAKLDAYMHDIEQVSA